MLLCVLFYFFFSSRRRHTRSVSAFLLNRSSDLLQNQRYGSSHIGATAKDRKSGSAVWLFSYWRYCKRSEERRVGKECNSPCWAYEQQRKKKREVEWRIRKHDTNTRIGYVQHGSK